MINCSSIFNNIHLQTGLHCAVKVYKSCRDECDLKLKSGDKHLCNHAKLALDIQSHSAPEHQIQKDEFRFDIPFFYINNKLL